MEPNTFTRQSILDRVMGDAEIAEQIAEMVKEDLPTFLTDLTNQIQSSQFSQAARTTHKLKGIAGNIGAEELMNVAKVLEDKLLESSETTSPKEFDLTTLEEESQKVLAVLH